MSENPLKSSSANFTIYPLLWIAISFALGIFLSSVLKLTWQMYFITCLAAVSTTIVFRKRRFLEFVLFAAFIAAGGLYFQIANNVKISTSLKSFYDEDYIQSGDPIEIIGVLQRNPELSVDGFFIDISSEKAVYKNSEFAVSGNIRLFAPTPDQQIIEEYQQLNLEYGSQISVACNLRREDDYLNPGVVLNKEILNQNNLAATGTIKSPLLVEKIGSKEVLTPLVWLYAYRAQLILFITKNFDIPTAGVLTASLLGDRHFIDKNTAEVFREGGTFHILVISGLHITFIGGLTLLLVRLFTRKRLWQFLITTVCLWAYSIVVGAEVPVVRAALMFTILLFSHTIHRKGTLLNALGACALILLIWRPSDLFTASFQLTFVSVSAIIVAAFPLIENLRAIGSWTPSVETPFPPNVDYRIKRFCEMLYWRETAWNIERKRNLWSGKLFKKPYVKSLEAKGFQKFARYLFEALLVSAVVQIWLLPFVIIYFHRLSFLGILTNLWVSIFILFESLAAVMTLVAANLSTHLAEPFIKLTEFFNNVLLSMPELLVRNDLASERLPHYSGALKSLYYFYVLSVLALTVLLQFWKPFSLRSNINTADQRIFRRSAILVFVVLTAVIVFHPYSAPAPNGRLQVDFLDVGQGDSALITFPGGETLLVDGGGKRSFDKSEELDEQTDEQKFFEPDRQNIGERVVSSFLWEKGCDRIDYILATHADADHMQGLTDVAENFDIGAALFGRTPLKNKEFSALNEVLTRKKIPFVVIARGDVLNIGGVKVEVLHPERDDAPGAVSDNNNSLVLRLTFGERSFLLTGDIEKETEARLLERQEFVKSDVVKAPHHGSRTSSTEGFINAAKAKLVIIPVGKHSPFGHPHNEVVERWKHSGAKVLTTGERGTVSVSTDGKDLQLKTFMRQ